MFNRKKFAFAVIVCLALVQLTACGKAKTEEDNEKENKAETEDFEYLYHDALKGEVLNKEEKESVQKEYKVIVDKFKSGIAEIGEIVYEDLEYEAIMADEAENVEFLVEEGDKVKKGDVLVTYDVVNNEIEIAEFTRDVERMEKEYSAGYDSKKAEINMAEHEL